jgi:radical SAM superfamily enzyme YgiQ (UPF0313 family)
MKHALIFNIHTINIRRPGGAYRIASFLREHGWDIEVIEWTMHWTQEELQELCRSRITDNTVFVGYSCFFSEWNTHVEDLAQFIRKDYPEVKQITGSQSKPRMESTAVDYYLTGFGEYAILELLKYITGNGPAPSFDPKYFGSKKVITANHFYPAFPMKSLMVKYEDRDFLEPTDWLTMEFSRGCKFKCLYCNFPVLGVKGDYTRDADDYYVQMMDAYDRFGITNYYASDETFNDRSEKITKFADVTRKMPFKPWFSGFIRGDLLVSRKQDWEPLAELGFLGQFYGIESMNHETAKAIGKGMHPDKLLPGLLEARNYFKTHHRKLYRGVIALMVGLPYESKDSVNKSLDWLVNNWQGEAFELWPLEIPIDYKTDVLSTLSVNWEKYGYREIKFDNLPKLKNRFAEVKHGISNLHWENDYMNFDEARHISDNFRSKANKEYKFTINSYGLDNFIQLGMTIDEALEYREEPSTPHYANLQKIMDERINDYKHKKLSI